MGVYSLRLGSSHHKKDGSLNKRGQARVAGKKPLIDTSELHRQIDPQVFNNVFTVNPTYAAIHQFGGQAGEATRSRFSMEGAGNLVNGPP